MAFPGKGDVHIGRDYLTHAFPDGRDGGLAHTYAITAHKAQGSTLPVARSVAVYDTSRAGLYVMLSRGRSDIRGYVFGRADLDHHLDEENWLPTLTGPISPLDRLTARLDHSTPQRLAGAQDPTAAAAHQLRSRHSLADLTRL